MYLFVEVKLLVKEVLHHFSEVDNSLMLKVVYFGYNRHLGKTDYHCIIMNHTLAFDS